MGRGYKTCPVCQTRMVRTGKKEKEYPALEGWIYTREYVCKGCGAYRIHSESSNLFIEGTLREQ